MYEGWLQYGNTVIVDNGATLAWAQQMLPGTIAITTDGECQAHADTYGPYVSPEADDAPWVYDSHPESRGFLGLYVEAMSGLDSPYGTVRVDDVTVEGGKISRRRLRHREVVVNGILLGVNRAAVEYGADWLSTILVNGCVSGAKRDRVDLRFYRHCPDDVATPCGGFVPDETGDCNTVRRRLSRVGLISGPRFGQRLVTGGTVFGLEVAFTLAAELPGIYQCQPTTVAASIPMATATQYDTEYFCCDESIDLADCVTINLPAISPLNSCFCEPWRVRRSGVTFDNRAGLHALDVGFTVRAGTTGLFDLSGSGGLRNFRITTYLLDDDESPPVATPVDDDMQCNKVIGMLEIGSLPAGYDLVFDPTRGSITAITDEGVEVDGSRFVSANHRYPFRMPRVPACSKVGVVFAADSNNLSSETAVINVQSSFVEIASGS